MANSFLARSRKVRFATQREFGEKVALFLKEHASTERKYDISEKYAQKKASLWESGQLIPTQEELEAISKILNVSISDLKDSFSVGVLPVSAADHFKSLAVSAGEGLIASCFAGRVKTKLFSEDEDALRQAIEQGVSVAIFFPFPLESATSFAEEYSAAFSQHHRIVWRTVVKFWRMLRSWESDGGTTPSVRLYRPRASTSPNFLFPPMFHRPTLLCEREKGRIRINLYTWIQGPENDGLYTISNRSLESSEEQAEFWELYFGDVFNTWSETGRLPDGDSYWKEYVGLGDDVED